MFAAGMVFAVVLLAILGGFLLFGNSGRADVNKIRDRLVGTAKEPKKTKSQKSAPALINTEDPFKNRLAVKLLKRFQLIDRLTQLIETAGLRWHAVRLIHGSLVLLLLASAMVWYGLPRPFNRAALIVGPIAGALPMLYVIRKGRSRLRKFEEQFPESLEFVARSMRAGHAFSVALEMLHREFQEPLSGEFRRAFDEQNLGLPLEVALQKLAKRIPSLDVHFFVSAVLLQKRTGGNLAELLDKLAYLIRERFKLRGRIRAISAHGRMTGTVLSLVPAVVAAMMFYVNPSYVMFFVTDPTGQLMMGGAIILQVIGYAVIKKIVSIEV